MDFGTIKVSTKPTIICYFQKGLKFSIKVEMEQQDWASTSFKKIVQRAVNVKVKASLRSSTMVQKLDAHFPKAHCPSHNTFSKLQTLGTTIKESQTEESKPKKAKQANSKATALLCSNEYVKPNYQEKKNEY